MRRASLVSVRRAGSNTRMRVWVLTALVCAGCVGVESDIRRLERREFFLSLVKGKDRGAGEYARTIEESSTSLQGGRYQYVAPTHLSAYLIERSVRGLGSTQIKGTDYLAFVTDRLLYVVNHDPTAATRALACEQLGNVLARLPDPGGTQPPKDMRGDQRINNVAQDLKKFSGLAKEGKRIKQSVVAARLEALADEVPPTFLSALQMVRSFAAKPVAGAGPGPIRTVADRLAPRIMRDSIVVALREIALGDPVREDVEPDPDALVRQMATIVLGTVRAKVALAAAVARVKGDVDPLEADRDARGAIVGYLGAIGGPHAFDACLMRLRDVDRGMRYLAQKALVQMTTVDLAPEYATWSAWRESRPEWQIPKTGDEKDDASGADDDS